MIIKPEPKAEKRAKKVQSEGIRLKPGRKMQITRSVYSLFHKLVKIAERAESAGDQENRMWALNQLQTMIQGKLKTVSPAAPADMEFFVKGAPGIGGPPPAKKPQRPALPQEDEGPIEPPLSSLIASAQGRG